MAEGWNITTRRADPEGGPDLREGFVVRVADPQGAIALVQSKRPGAIVLVEREASPEVFEDHGIKLGEAYLLPVAK
jgi:hypothetical protein